MGELSCDESQKRYYEYMCNNYHFTDTVRRPVAPWEHVKLGQTEQCIRRCFDVFTATNNHTQHELGIQKGVGNSSINSNVPNSFMEFLLHPAQESKSHKILDWRRTAYRVYFRTTT